MIAIGGKGFPSVTEEVPRMAQVLKCVRGHDAIERGAKQDAETGQEQRLHVERQAVVVTTHQTLEDLHELLPRELLGQVSMRIDEDQTPIASDFSASRWHPIYGGYRPHHGVDLAAPYDDEVRSAAAGTVVFAGEKGAAGLKIEIDHGALGRVHRERRSAPPTSAGV